jgi:hypothetical protein
MRILFSIAISATVLQIWSLKEVCMLYVPYLKHVQIASGELVPFIANTIMKIKKDICLNAKRNCFLKSTEERLVDFSKVHCVQLTRLYIYSTLRTIDTFVYSDVTGFNALLDYPHCKLMKNARKWLRPSQIVLVFCFISMDYCYGE